jgi:hypothetical protein
MRIWFGRALIIVIDLLVSRMRASVELRSMTANEAVTRCESRSDGARTDGLRAMGERPHGADALGAAWARQPPDGWGRSPFARDPFTGPRRARHRLKDA